MELFYVAAFIIFLGALLFIFKTSLEKLVDKVNESEVLPYRAKQYLFSRSEHEFLRLLHQGIDTRKYLVFPKVRLGDFIEVTERGKNYQRYWNKIRSKH